MKKLYPSPRARASIADVAADIHETGRANEFIRIAKALASTGGQWNTAANDAKSLLLPSRAVEIMRKTAVTPLNTSGASPLMEEGLVAAFVGSLRNLGVFDAMLNSMVRVPLRTRIAITTLGATAASNAELAPRKLSSLSLAQDQLDQRRVDAIIIISEELARSTSVEAFNLFASELRKAVVKETDTVFLAIASAGITPFNSSGPTAAGARQDLRTLLQAVDTGEGSALFYIMGSAIAKALSIISDPNGSSAFPNMRYDGGDIGGVPVLVSDAIAGGRIMLVDASAFAAGSGDFEFDDARHATIQFETAPDSPVVANTVATSLWQQNLTALKTTRYLGAERLRSTSVAIVQYVAFSGNSPA